MPTERQTLTNRRDSLLNQMNSKGEWDHERYSEVVDLEKRISGLPEEHRPPRKGR